MRHTQTGRCVTARTALALVAMSGALPEDAAALCPPNVTNAVTISTVRFLNEPCSILGPNGVLTIDSPGALTLAATLFNRSLLNNNALLNTGGGELRNFGTLNNNAFATLENFGGLTVEIGGTLNNTGVLRNFDGLRNRGDLNNDNILTNGATLLNSGRLTNTASLTNSGDLTNAAGATLTVSAAGTLLNEGTLTGQGSSIGGGSVLQFDGGMLINQGTLTNQGATGGSGSTINMRGGTLTNNGTLTGSGSSSGGGAVFNLSGTELNNNNRIEIQGATSATGAPAALNIELGRLTNMGTLVVGRGLDYSTAGSLNINSGVLNNAVHGVIRIELNGNLNVVPANINGTVGPASSMGNDGLLINDGWLSVAAGSQLSNRASLTNNFVVQSGGWIFNSRSFDNNNLLSNSGFLTNEGGSAGVAGGILNNRGDVQNAGETHNSGGSAAASPGAVFNNYATFNNRALVENGAGSSGGLPGVFNNFGRLEFSYVDSEFRNNGIVNNSGSFDVAAVGTVNGTGTYIQTAGTTTANGVITQGTFDCQGGTVNGTSRITATTMLHYAAACNLDPGNSTGTLTLDGGAAGVDFEGRLNIEIAGLIDHDILRVLSGGIHFDDAIIHFLFDGYEPAAGDTFDFLDGTFDGTYRFSYEGLRAGYSFDLARDANGHLGLRTLAAPGSGGGSVPLPGTLLLALLGFGGLGLVRAHSGAGLAGRSALRA